MKSTFFKRFVTVIAVLSLLLPLSACGESQMSQKEVYAMDTIMTLTAYGQNREAGLNAAEGVIRSIEAMVDPDLETSIVYKINHANGESVIVPGQVANMISTAQTVYTQTEGNLDITIYPLIKRWGFVDRKYYVPTYEEVAEDLTRLCFDRLVLTSFPSSGTYQVQCPSFAEISLAAVAKGTASNNAISAMKSSGVESGIISLGGNIQTLGLHPDGTKWRVGLTDPNNTSSYVGILEVGESAIVTSGDYQRFFTQGGKTYHHLLKPSTGYPVENSLRSVTIVCSDGTMADCLSTALFVSGESAALNYWRTYGQKTELFDMILITNDNRIICTSGLIEAFTISNTNYTVSYTE